MRRVSATRMAVAFLASTWAPGCATHVAPGARLGEIRAHGGAAADRREAERTPPARGDPAAGEPELGGRTAPALETQDPALAAGLRAVARLPTPAHHGAVAAEYRRLGVLDAAFDHLTEAIRLDPRDAAAFDARARIWRDWGFPQLGMGDAVRAVHHAPESAAAHNTWGTLLAAMGLRGDARRQFDTALTLDPRASYALVNLCYLDFVAGEVSRAIDECQRAVALDPATATRNNLGLSHAAAGQFDLAEEAFIDASGEIIGSYNVGILYLSAGQFTRAVEVFERVSRMRPFWNPARARATQARVLAKAAAATANAEVRN